MTKDTSLTTRQTHEDGSAFSEAAAYSRAVRAGDYIAVSGTAPIGPDGPLHPGDVYAQTLFVLTKALEAAEALGARKEHVLRTRMLLALGADWREAVRAHAEIFAEVRPANTTYFVAGFIPDVLVEVELDAVVTG